MSEMDEIIESMKMKGIFLMDDEEAAVRKLAEVRTLRSALAMFETSPFVMHNIVRTATKQFKLVVESRNEMLKDYRTLTPDTAGGESRMVSITTGPAPITMDELLKLVPQATKEATTFEKSPKWEPKVGEAILAKIKLVRKGSFELPLVIANERVPVTENGNGAPIKGDFSLPTYVVARCAGKDGGGLTDPQTQVTKPGKFEEGKVYFIRVVGTKDTGKINPYVQVVTIGPLSDFPKAGT